MRDDIAQRYQQLTTAPQKIVFSDVAEEHRTAFIGPRPELSAASARAVSSETEFSMGAGVGNAADSAGSAAAASQNPATADVTPVAVGTAVELPAVERPAVERPAAGTDSSGNGRSAATADSAATAAAPVAADADELLSIAIQEQKESARRRKASGIPLVQIIMPCPACGALVRTTEEFSGKLAGCQKCGTMVLIPVIDSPAPKEKKLRKKVSPSRPLTWLTDGWLHSFLPTSLVLKPGSMADNHVLTDIALTESALFVVQYRRDSGKYVKGPPAEGAEKTMMQSAREKLLSYLRRSPPEPEKVVDEIRERWKKLREYVAKTGEFKDFPNAEIRFITSEHVRDLRLVQPITRVQESMFAGVPVFGDGRIATFLPLKSADGQQSYLSLPLSTFRVFNERLTSLFSAGLPASENGVPETEKSDSFTCHLNQSRFDAVSNVAYYQRDPGYELELVGYRCTSCGITISESGRAAKKLGGSNAKGLIKTKCPKCGGKFGYDPLYRIARSPEVESSVDSGAEGDAVAPSTDAAASGAI